MTDKQTEAIASANELLALAKQIQTIDVAIKSLTTRAGSRGYQTMWNALNTYAYNADGSIGAPDATPIVGRPIFGVNISASDLATVLDIIQKYQDCGNNVAVAAVARISTLNAKLN